MDEFESRLDRELRRQASATPDFSGDFQRVRGRGRRRLWLSRGAGAAVLVVAVAAGYLLIDSADDGGQTVSATDGGIPVIVPAPTATPAPLPTPTPDETTDERNQDEPTATPDPASVVRDVSLLTATGWGVGLAGPTGDVYATLVCCKPPDPAWYEQDPTAPAMGARTVRDDLRGGLVASSANALYWLPADALAGSEAEMLVSLAADETSVASVQLWDVRELENSIDVLYSVHERSIDAAGGSASLRRVSLSSDDPEPETLETTSWDQTEGAGHTWAGAAWTLEGGYMSLKRHHSTDCEWIEYAGPGEELYSSPFPAPADPFECPHLSIGAATLNSDGEIAIIERHRSPAPQLVVYDRAANRLETYPLPQGTDGQETWSEIDMAGATVVVSRSHKAAPHPRALKRDETFRVDFASSAPPRPVPFVGSPALARSDISTDDLDALQPDSELWFVQSGDVDDTASPGPPTEVDESGSSDPDDEEGEPEPPEDPPVVSLPGQDGCLADICLGTESEAALEAAAARHGEGTPVGSDLTLFVDSEAQISIWVGTADTRVVSVALSPVDLTPVGVGGSDVPALDIGTVLAALGAPSEVDNTILGEDRVVWLTYTGEEQVASFGHLTSVSGDQGQSALQPEGDTSLPERYDDLVVNIVRIAQNG